MRRTSSHFSDESFISVEPAVARQITGTSRSRTSQRTSRTAASTKKPPSAYVAPGSREESRKPTRKQSTRGDASSKRSNSLKRVKNSTEILRERSQKASGESKIDLPQSSREGRSFTVSNVGTGGMLYLRPATKQQHLPIQSTPFVFLPLTPPKSAFLPDDEQAGQAKEADNRLSVWSDSQSSEKLALPVKRSNTSATRKPAQPPNATRLGRSYSFSTVDDHHKTSTETRDRTLRIVIDRSAPHHPATTPQNFALPSLSVPIPNFRLGKPVFSAYGTAALRSSAYTKTSAVQSETSEDTTDSEGENFIFPAPPKKQSGSRRLSDDDQVGARSSKMVMVRKVGLDQREDSVQPDDGFREHVLPAIFDEISRRRDDPSLVRYSNSTGEISAATPARIIAQISSESFMDYDLVSDFFLTFRSYLSTNDVLDLLLARLRWSIQRLEDDGRVVRIRTFAALRHWILNYFMDDFVVNRSLRLRFCEEINSMHHEVAARPDGGGSDLKILQDLKRCWNGRCSLYWDSPEFSVDVPQHLDIVPGGLLGSRVSTPSVFAKIEVISQEKPKEEPKSRKGKAAQSWFGVPPKARKASDHRRQNSEAGASISSEQSIQPTSCSIPARIVKRTGSGIERGRSPKPASVQMRRRKAPSNLALAPSNERLAKAKAQQPAAPPTHQASPIKPTGEYGSPPITFESNFIRGQLLPPASALIEVLPPTSAAPDMSTFDLGTSDQTQNVRDSKSSGRQSPAIKGGMLGSIRRALSTKPGYGPISAPLSVSATPLPGRTAALPLTVAKSIDNLRVTTNAPPVRTKLRIDLLCAAVVQSYEKAITAAGPIGIAVSPGEDLLRPGRLMSTATAQSGSILIVDETGLDLPLMSGALPAHQHHNVHFDISDPDLSTGQGTHLDIPRPKMGSHSQSSSYRSTPLTAEKLQENDSRRSLPLNTLGQDVSLPPRTSSLHYNGQHASTASSTTLRRHGSIMSSNGHGKDPSINATTMTLSSGRESAEEDDTAKGPPPPLRRRPGGDLRNNENVHDLETTIHHDSIDSDMTGGSLVIMGNSRNSKKQATGPKRISMINTHSSQHLRPSFEAVVAGFSAIPDDDDGGIEATLLKLEGSYEKTSPALSQEEANEVMRGIMKGSRDAQAEAERKRNRQEHVQEDVPEDVAAMPALENLSDSSASGKAQSSAESRITAMRKPIFTLPEDSVTGSHDSLDSIPILQRGLSDSPVTVVQRTPGKLQVLPTRIGSSPLARNKPASPGHSFEMVEETDSMRQANRPQESSARSFYYEEDEMLSDLSSEISVDIINYSDAENAFSPMFAAPGTAISGLELPSHPLGHSEAEALALHRLGTPTEGRRSKGPHMPLTPDTSPLQEHLPQDKDSFLEEITAPQKLEPKQEAVRVPSSPGHIPFILACDSIVLAQQFTLVEQAALTEIDWNDLVEMRWDNKSANISDWVEYICKQDNKGVDLVITRFNLVVKWALSEIVMTHDIHERARVLAKFIHIAAHCRRLHNYATMLQITIALTSIDCARLTKTWELVSSPDRSLLKNMEALIQPVRNFHDLRVEMEESDLSDGCVPFIGLYVHDLTYNAQKPSVVEGDHPGGEKLVNFARYRTAAGIVKNLLRLIDASARYEFVPVEGVVERCLWLACLSDRRIREASRALE